MMKPFGINMRHIKKSPYFSIAIVFCLSYCVHCIPEKEPIKNDHCEYNLDLVANTIRVKCHGHGASVHIYADDAQVNPVPYEHGDRSQKMTPQKDYVPRGDLRVNDAAPLPDVVWNSTHTLEKLKTRLKKHTSAMANITSLLINGDADLSSDLDRLGRVDPGSRHLRDGLLASMKNQHNFMRTAILTQNAELSRLLRSLDTLIDVTSYGFRSALKSHNDLRQQINFLNQTMANVSKELRKRKKEMAKAKKKNKHGSINKPCLQEIAAIGMGDAIDVKSKKGTFMKDAAIENSRIWILQGAGPSDLLLEYETEKDVKLNLKSRSHYLPVKCESTGSVVYKGHLYCQESGTRKIIKYDIQKMEITQEKEIPDAGISNTYPYQDVAASDIDLAVDEQGLWVIYSTELAAGKILISNMEDDTMELRSTWMTSFPKKMAGNSFMICGILYVTNSNTDNPIYIKYMYDTNTRIDKVLEAGALVLSNTVSGKKSNVAMLDYNPGERRLYAWDNGQVEIYRVFFKHSLWT